MIRQIIFDLGGVLLDIDYSKTVNAFRELGIPNPELAFSKAHQSMLFQKYEKGEINSKQFLDSLQLLVPDADRGAIVDAWNALLGYMPAEKWDIVSRLHQIGFRLFVLSNTNALHKDVFECRIDGAYGWDRFASAFEYIYYSHEIGMRKPDPAIFRKVIENHHLEASATLFIDDTAEHVAGAMEAGLTAHHLQEDENLRQVLMNYGIGLPESPKGLISF